jgi:two-component system CheB/CheR fusion protein
MIKTKPELTKDPSKQNDELYLLAVASFADEFDELKRLFSNLSHTSSTNLCIVLAQYINPDQKGQLVKLLAKEYPWSLKEAVANSKLEQAVIYFTPPNRNISINENTVQLSKHSSAFKSMPSTALLFKSVAENFREKAIALILSDLNSNDLRGFKEIRNHQGICLFQKPKAAAYSARPKGVPSHRSDTISKDNEISEVLNQICSGKQFKSNNAVADAQHEWLDLEAIFNLLQERSSVDFRHYKSIAFKRRLEGRLKQIHKINIAEYRKYIENNPSEINDLSNYVLARASQFFQDPLASKELEKNILSYLSTKSAKTIRIWHPGCASGEEAYATSILLHEILGADIQSWDIQIFATDIDNEAISEGRRGEFPSSSLSMMDDALAKKYFIEDDNFVQVKQNVKSLVSFYRHDFTSNPPFLKLDLVSCQNLLIKLDTELQKRVISIFHYSLEENALLFLGDSQGLVLQSELFATISKADKLWSRRGNSPKVAPPLSITKTATPLTFKPNRLSSNNKSIAERVEEILFSSHDEPYIVINENLDIQYISGNVLGFLRSNPKEMFTNILSQCKEETEMILGQTIQKAIATSASAHSSPRQLKNKDKLALFRFRVHPMLDLKETSYLVIYECMEVDYQAVNTERVDTKEWENIRISELQLELDTSRKHFQGYIKELEASNEELQRTNAELQGANEKLNLADKEPRLTNKLIETREKKLAKANLQLETILNSDLQGFIMCNNDFDILHYNKYAYDTLKGLSAKVLNFKNGLIDCLPKEWVAGFVEIFQESITKGENFKKQFNIQLKNREKKYILVSFRPVTGNKEENNKHIVIRILDNTEEFTLTNKLKRTNKLLDQVSEVVKIGGWEMAVDTKLTTWTKVTYDIHKLEIDFPLEPNKALIFHDSIDQLEINRLINEVINTGNSLEGYFDFFDFFKNKKTVEIKAFPYYENGVITNVWGTIQDITQEQEQKKKNESLNEELLRSNIELKDFAYMASHDLQEPLRMITSFTDILDDEYAESFDDEGKQYLSFITNGAKRMQDMLSDILKYSLINTNDEPTEPVNLNVLINEVLINFNSIINAKQISIDVGELTAIKGVPSLLVRLFQNLISNAIKYNNGIPQISIWSENNDNDLSIYIKDNGIGIDSTQFEHIFGIFKRLHSAQDYPGSGIGLAICMRIMNKHHGTIKVLSSSKDGSVFLLEFTKNEP